MESLLEGWSVRGLRQRIGSLRGDGGLQNGVTKGAISKESDVGWRETVVKEPVEGIGRRGPESEGTTLDEAVRLLLWEELPEWQQRGSEHIQTGYRRATNSVWTCVKSWAYVHNETVNIWSHVVGAVIFFSLPAYVFATEIPPRYRVATTTDMLACSAWFLGVATCFLLSTVFHTLMAHSQALYDLGIQLDFQGVLILMWSATVPLIHYTFDGRPMLAGLYHGGTAVVVSLVSTATLHPVMGAVHLGHFRARLFAAFGVGSFIVPIVHGMLLDGLEVQRARVGLEWVIMTAVCNGLGMAAYSFKFPEWWFPRRFDIFGASHQIMHIMVLFAAFAYTRAVLTAFDYHHNIHITGWP